MTHDQRFKFEKEFDLGPEHFEAPPSLLDAILDETTPLTQALRQSERPPKLDRWQEWMATHPRKPTIRNLFSASDFNTPKQKSDYSSDIMGTMPLFHEEFLRLVEVSLDPEVAECLICYVRNGSTRCIWR